MNESFTTMYRLNLLGGLELQGPEGSGAGRARQRRQLALLAVLALDPEGTVRREKVVAWLWSESSEERARHSLSDTLYVIREALGEGAIEVRGDEIRLNPAMVTSDLAEFRSALEEGDLDRAIDLYRGPLLDGVNLQGSERLERAIADERARLEERAAKIARRRAEELRADGELAGAERRARRALRIDPLNEAALRLLIRILDERGDRASAIRTYESFRERMEAEWDLEPAPETRTVVEEIRAGEPELDAVSDHAAPGPDRSRPRAPGGRSPVRWVMAGVALVLLLVVAAVVGVLDVGESSSLVEDVSLGTPGHPDDRPLVVMMDSPHPSRVYDDEVREANGSNADVISDILLDLPVVRQKEAISPEWHRDQEILRFDPELVIIHYSGFRQGRTLGSRVRLRLFIEYFAETDTKFLVYSRQSGEILQRQLEELLAPLEREHPGITRRVRAFGVVDYGPPEWKNPIVANHLKLAVKEMLELE